MNVDQNRKEGERFFEETWEYFLQTTSRNHCLEYFTRQKIERCSIKEHSSKRQKVQHLQKVSQEIENDLCKQILALKEVLIEIGELEQNINDEQRRAGKFLVRTNKNNEMLSSIITLSEIKIESENLVNDLQLQISEKQSEQIKCIIEIDKLKNHVEILKEKENQEESKRERFDEEIAKLQMKRRMLEKLSGVQIQSILPKERKVIMLVQSVLERQLQVVLEFEDNQFREINSISPSIELKGRFWQELIASAVQSNDASELFRWYKIICKNSSYIQQEIKELANSNSFAIEYNSSKQFVEVLFTDSLVYLKLKLPFDYPFSTIELVELERKTDCKRLLQESESLRMKLQKTGVYVKGWIEACRQELKL